MNKTKKYFIKNKSSIIVLVVVLIGLISFIGLRQWVIYKDKSQLSKVEQSMIGLTDSLKEKNSLIDGTVNRFCRQDQEKFGGGKKSCGIEIKFKSINREHSNKVENDLNSVLLNDYQALFQPKFQNSIYLGGQRAGPYSFTHIKSEIECLFTYQIDGSINTYKNITPWMYCSKYVNNYIY